MKQHQSELLWKQGLSPYFTPLALPPLVQKISTSTEKQKDWKKTLKCTPNPPTLEQIISCFLQSPSKPLLGSSDLIQRPCFNMWGKLKQNGHIPSSYTPLRCQCGYDKIINTVYFAEFGTSFLLSEILWPLQHWKESTSELPVRVTHCIRDHRRWRHFPRACVSFANSD